MKRPSQLCTRVYYELTKSSAPVGFKGTHRLFSVKYLFGYIVYVIESAAYGVLFTSCLCQNPNERGTSE